MARSIAPGCSIRLAGDVALAGLRPLVEAIFGVGDRPADWFVRKLAREGVDPRCSALALGPDGERVGYLLVGDEPGETTAHFAGLGVLPEFRGRGLGPALIERSVEALRLRGATALRALAEPQLRSFYARLGFAALAERHTLNAPATGAADLRFADHPPRPWQLPGRAVAGWRAGTWSRTPTALAATVSLEHGAAHLSREGRAILVQRLCVDVVSDEHLVEAAARSLVELRRRFTRGTPLLLYGCNTVSCVTADWLQQHGCSVAQTSCEMQLALA